MFVLVVVRQHEEQLAGAVFFVVGFVCACCYLGADCHCGLPFSCDVFDVKMKVASHNNKDHCTRQ